MSYTTNSANGGMIPVPPQSSSSRWSTPNPFLDSAPLPSDPLLPPHQYPPFAHHLRPLAAPVSGRWCRSNPNDPRHQPDNHTSSNASSTHMRPTAPTGQYHDGSLWPAVGPIPIPPQQRHGYNAHGSQTARTNGVAARPRVRASGSWTLRSMATERLSIPSPRPIKGAPSLAELEGLLFDHLADISGKQVSFSSWMEVLKSHRAANREQNRVDDRDRAAIEQWRRDQELQEAKRIEADTIAARERARIAWEQLKERRERDRNDADESRRVAERENKEMEEEMERERLRLEDERRVRKEAMLKEAQDRRQQRADRQREEEEAVDNGAAAPVNAINVASAHFSSPTLSTLSPTLSRLHQRGKQAQERLEEIRKAKEEDILRRNLEKQKKIELIRVARADAEESVGQDKARAAAERRQRVAEHTPLPPLPGGEGRIRRPSVDSNMGGNNSEFGAFGSRTRRPSQDFGSAHISHQRRSRVDSNISVQSTSSR